MYSTGAYYAIKSGTPTWTYPTLTACTFTRNEAWYGGGGAVYNYSSSPTFTACGFNENDSWYYHGGGIYNYGGNPTFTNCTIDANSASGYSGGGMYNTNSSIPTLTTCRFSENAASAGGAVYNNGSSPKLVDCVFGENLAQSAGGGISNVKGSSSSNPVIIKCIFFGNTATASSARGGGLYNEGSSPTLTNCAFSGNLSNYRGGAMYNGSVGSPATTSDPKITNCTFSMNSAIASAGGLYNDSSAKPRLVGCILWGNSGSQIYSGLPLVSYCCVQDGFIGIGNISLDPLFVSPVGADGVAGTADDDLSLTPGSPCIDAGNNGAPDLFGITTDLEGNPRFLDDPDTADTGNGWPPIIDMGAYEYDPMRDDDGDGVRNLDDQCPNTVPGASP